MMPPMLELSNRLSKNLTHAYATYGHRAISATQLFLAIAIAWVSAGLIWSLAPTPQSATWRPAPVVSTATANAKGPDLDLIIGAKLFGIYQPQGSNLAAAPDTSLSLTLLGIFAGPDKEHSRALIGQQNGDEKPYAIGQDVVGGVTVQAIFPDRIILSRSGQLETLRLDKDKPSSNFLAPADSSTPGADASQLGQVRKELLMDPNKAAEYIRIQPANVDGKMRGFRVYPGQKQNLFNGTGLQPGDLVTSVNGVQLDDTQKALQMLNDLSKAGNVSVVVDRGGQSQTINVSFN
jgi:general secretion pathway protein C